MHKAFFMFFAVRYFPFFNVKLAIWLNCMIINRKKRRTRKKELGNLNGKLRLRIFQIEIFDLKKHQILSNLNLFKMHKFWSLTFVGTELRYLFITLLLRFGPWLANVVCFSVGRTKTWQKCDKGILAQVT